MNGSDELVGYNVKLSTTSRKISIFTSFTFATTTGEWYSKFKCSEFGWMEASDVKFKFKAPRHCSL